MDDIVATLKANGITTWEQFSQQRPMLWLDGDIVHCVLEPFDHKDWIGRSQSDIETELERRGRELPRSTTHLVPFTFADGITKTVGYDPITKKWFCQR